MDIFDHFSSLCPLILNALSEPPRFLSPSTTGWLVSLLFDWSSRAALPDYPLTSSENMEYSMAPFQVSPLSSSLITPFPRHQGGCLGIQLDESGRLAESSIANIAILTPQGMLRTPPFEKILAGTTVKRLWELAEETLKPQGKKKQGEASPPPSPRYSHC